MRTQTAVQAAKPRDKPYQLSDGNGPYLLIETNGSKLWRLRYFFDSKEKMLSLGSFPDVTIKSGPSWTVIIHVRNIVGLATKEASHPSMMKTRRATPPLYPRKVLPSTELARHGTVYNASASSKIWASFGSNVSKPSVTN
jgi:hypothetical protein